MHLNPRQPNILNDMLALAKGVDLRNGPRIPLPDGRMMVAPNAKRHLIPRKDYRHCADAQVVERDIPATTKAETGT